MSIPVFLFTGLCLGRGWSVFFFDENHEMTISKYWEVLKGVGVRWGWRESPLFLRFFALFFTFFGGGAFLRCFALYPRTRGK